MSKHRSLSAAVAFVLTLAPGALHGQQAANPHLPVAEGGPLDVSRYRLVDDMLVPRSEGSSRRSLPSSLQR